MTNLIDRMLGTLEHDVLPLTRQGVSEGNKIFGAAILKKNDLGLVIAGTNLETHNPLYHGEISCLNNYWALAANTRPKPRDCLFLSTHEPCAMCLSAITWSGFDNFYYLFSYEDSRDGFNIPHDLKIIDQVFGLPEGGYQRSNEFWTCHHLPALVNHNEDGVDQTKQLERQQRLTQLRQSYDELSSQYQSSKGKQGIPLD